MRASMPLWRCNLPVPQKKNRPPGSYPTAGFFWNSDSCLVPLLSQQHHIGSARHAVQRLHQIGEQVRQRKPPYVPPNTSRGQILFQVITRFRSPSTFSIINAVSAKSQSFLSRVKEYASFKMRFLPAQVGKANERPTAPAADADDTNAFSAHMVQISFPS